MAKTRITLIGAEGRLGKAIQNVLPKDRIELVASIGRMNAGDFSKHVPNTDVFLDVSLPIATEGFLSYLTKQGAKIPYVIGCTGWNDAQLKAVHDYAKNACVIFAPNFSPGVNLFLGLIEKAAPRLAKWGYDVSVHEIHHTKKLDAPSGTAKAIIERLGQMKPQVHATRAGNIVGIHEVRFISAGDALTFTHEALDRSIFARGALMAAEWAEQHTKAGFFSMQDVVFSDGNEGPRGEREE